MQRALDPGPVVVAELPNVVGDVIEIGTRHGVIGEQLDLLVPAAALHTTGSAAYALDRLGGHPNDGTSPFSRTGTRTASSLTRSSCVNSMLNPRPRRASIMCES